MSRQLLLRNCPHSASEAALVGLFSQRVEKVIIPRDSHGQRRGYCFLQFESHEVAMQAAASHPDFFFEGRRVTCIVPAPKKDYRPATGLQRPTAFLGGIRNDATFDELYQYFEKFWGKVHSLNLPLHPSSGGHRGFAYLQMVNSADHFRILSTDMHQVRGIAFKCSPHDPDHDGAKPYKAEYKLPGRIANLFLTSNRAVVWPVYRLSFLRRWGLKCFMDNPARSQRILRAEGRYVERTMFVETSEPEALLLANYILPSLIRDAQAVPPILPDRQRVIDLGIIGLSRLFPRIHQEIQRQDFWERMSASEPIEASMYRLAFEEKEKEKNLDFDRQSAKFLLADFPVSLKQDFGE